jgi:Concanavalin A-like lectin/glucanases superfamily
VKAHSGKPPVDRWGVRWARGRGAVAGAARRRGTVSLVLAALVVLSATFNGVAASFSATTASAGSVAAAAAFARCYDDAVAASSPLSYWRLDETSGTSAADQVGSRPGTYTGGYTLGQSPALRSTGTSTTFNGSTGYVNVPYAAALNPAAVTVEAWVYPTGGAGTWRAVASSWKNASGIRAGYWLGINASNQWQFSVAQNTNGETDALTTPVTLNTWTHLVGTLSGTTLSLYVNGTLQATATGTYTAAPSPTEFRIGSEYLGGVGGSFFPGSIDEVAVYGSALSAATVRTHYNTGRCYADDVFKDSPAGYWRLGEASGSTLKDAADNANFGAYTASPTLGVAGAPTGTTDTAVTFNGTTQYASVPYTGQLNPASFTVEAWAKPTGGTGTARTVVASQDTNKGYLLGIGTDNKWRFTIGTGSATTVVTSTNTVTLSSWAHVVGTYDGSTATLYVNGLSTGTPATSVTVSANTTRPLGIGATDTGGTWAGFFPGSIDEAAVYSSSLSSTRVQAHYLMGRSYLDTVKDSSAIDFWRLGESSNANPAADSVGSNPGSYVSSPAVGQTGALAGDADTSVTLNGSSQYVNVPYNASLNPATQFSVELWVKQASSAMGTYRSVISSWSTGTVEKGYWIGSFSTDLWRFQVGVGSGSGVYNEAVGPAVVAGTWTHLVGTYNGTTAILYVNGAFANSVNSGYTANSTKPLTLGVDAYSSLGGYDAGQIDDVAVYNRVLSPSEVALHYNSGLQ